MGTIYFIQGNPDTPIKIGFTQNKDVSSRMSGLQTGYPWTLRCLMRIHNGDQNLERRIHALFEVERLRGEWFDPSPRLLLFIRELSVSGDADLVVERTEASSDFSVDHISDYWLSESSVPTMFNISSGLISTARKSGSAPPMIVRQNGMNTIRYYNVAQVKTWLARNGVRYAINWALAHYHLRTADSVGYSAETSPAIAP